MLRAGVVGSVREVHIWTNRPIWPQGMDRPAGEDPVPARLKWDLWLGPAPVRPFKDKWPKGKVVEGKASTPKGNVYQPFVWRGWWDFGTGALGDMGCHNINMAYMGLDLRDPVSVRAETSGHNKASFPSWSIVTYEFAANGQRPGLKMVWYDGGKLPPAEICGGEKPSAGGGSLVIGEKGMLWGDTKLLGGAEKKTVEYPKSPGHFEEWVNAIRGGPQAMSNFPDYAGSLAETVLLGNLAVWAASSGKGEKIEWDAEQMKAKNVSGLESLIKPAYRSGYTLDA